MVKGAFIAVHPRAKLRGWEPTHSSRRRVKDPFCSEGLAAHISRPTQFNARHDSDHMAFHGRAVASRHQIPIARRKIR